jgi:hypothetical protein
MKWPVLLAAVALAAPTAAAGQDRADPMAETVTQWFTMIERQFVSLADAMPADRWSFAPKDGEFKGVRTFAEQVKHVACANYGFFRMNGIVPPASAPATR